MSQALYDLGRKAFLDGAINYASDTIKCELIRTVQGPGAGGAQVYAVNLGTDQYLNIIPNNAYCRPTSGQAQALGTKTDTAGVAGAANATFTSVPLGDPIQAIVIYKDTGTASTSPLIAYIDGKVIVTLAANAAAHATTLAVDPLLAPLGSGAVILFATSGVQVTLTANAAKGARSLSVSDIGNTPINAGDTGPCLTQGANLPITPNGGSLTINWDATYQIFKL